MILWNIFLKTNNLVALTLHFLLSDPMYKVGFLKSVVIHTLPNSNRTIYWSTSADNVLVLKSVS